MTAVRLDQGMAAIAAGMLEETIGRDLRTRYRQLPIMLRTGGLATTYAYIIGKTDASTLGRAYGKVAGGIREHVNIRRLVEFRVESDLDLLTAFGEMSVTDYLRASAEVEALAGWLSRLSEARYQAGLLATNTGIDETSDQNGPVTRG